MTSSCVPAFAVLVFVLLSLLHTAGVGAAYSMVYHPADAGFGHMTGSVCGSDGAWCVTVADPTNTWMTYGPYATGYPANATLTVSFLLAVDNNTNDENQVVVLSVTADEGHTVLASRTVIRTDFLHAPLAPQCFTTAACYARRFSLLFAAPSTNSGLEFRVFYVNYAAVTHYATYVEEVVDSTATGLFWEGGAHLQPISLLGFPTPGMANSSASMNVGFDFVSRGSVLYVFHREFGFAPTPSYCPPVYARILVRASTDGGRTFGGPVVIATPQPGTATECGLVDGAAYYDDSSNSWVYLSQCITRSSVWNLCLFTFTGSDPMASGGLWTASPANPVVRSGHLWATICCTTRPCHCDAGTMGSEGTPEIVGISRGYFYVTFHGWDPTHAKSARGVARTQDFVTWETRGPGLPGDAIFSSVDCNPWSIQWAAGGCIGGGEGSIIRSGGYMYQIIEAPDVSLGCLTAVGEQNWVLGLLRSPDMEFLPTGGWQQFPLARPAVIPTVKQGCYIQYQRLFLHDGNVYFGFWAGVNGGSYHLHILVPGAGSLPIVAVEKPF